MSEVLHRHIRNQISCVSERGVIDCNIFAAKEAQNSTPVCKGFIFAAVMSRKLYERELSENLI